MRLRFLTRGAEVAVRWHALPESMRKPYGLRCDVAVERTGQDICSITLRSTPTQETSGKVSNRRVSPWSRRGFDGSEARFYSLGAESMSNNPKAPSKYLKDFGVALYCGFGRQPG